MDPTHPAPAPRADSALSTSSSWRTRPLRCGALRTVLSAAAWRRSRRIERRAARVAAGRRARQPAWLPASGMRDAGRDDRWIL